MATQIVELTGDEASLLRSLDKVIQKQVEYERKLRDTSEQGDAAGTALQGALAKVQAEGDKALNGLLRELKTLGPEGSTAAAALRSHLQDAGKAGHKSFDTVIAQIRAIDPAAAEAAEAAAASFDAAGEAAQVEWRNQLQLLRELGPEGSAAAAQIERDMKAAAAEAAGGMEQVLAKLEQIDPTVAASAARVRTELAEAAQYSEREFGGVLDELRKIGPEGRQAAAELRQHLVDAGKIAEKSMHDIASKLDNLDPESAKAARAIINNIESASTKSTSAFAKFGKSAIAEIGSVVTAYVGVQEAIQLVNGYLEAQRDILRETKDTQIELAKAQQESAKNLAGLSVVERDDLLRNAVPEIAAATGFSDVAEITQALGAVASAGESNSAKIREAVEQAARIERLTPQQLDTTASAASAVQRQSGLADIRQAIALVETTGTQARITDPQKLVEALPRAVGSLVSTVPTQDKETAAREAAALFAQITQGGNDEKGTSSATFAIDLGTRLSKVFTELEDDQVKARSKIELIDRKIAKGTETELDLQNKTRLTEYLEASKGLVDPATLFGRLQTVQGSPALQRQLVGEGFGEKQFQTALTSLLDPTSDLSNALTSSFNTIQANEEFFEREARQLVDLTPQLSTAAFESAISASRTAQQVSNNEGASLQAIRDAATDVFDTTRPTGVSGIIDYALDFSAYGGLGGSTAAEEALSLTESLVTRANLLRSDGIQAGDEDKLKRISQTLETVYAFVERQGQSGALDAGGVGRARQYALDSQDVVSREGSREQLDNLKRMADLLQRIADQQAEPDTDPAPQPIEQPNVTPALSNVQP